MVRLVAAANRGETLLNQTLLPETNGTAYRALFEASPDPMWVYDVSSFEFLEVNRAACSFYGFTREEFLRMNILQIRPPNNIPEVLRLVAERGVHAGQGLTHLRKNGELVTVRVVSVETEFDGKPARIVTVRDVADQASSRQAPKNAVHAMEAIVAASPSSIFSVDRSGIITTWNPATEALLGISSRETIGTEAWKALGADRFVFDELLSRVLAGETVSGTVVKLWLGAERELDLLVGAAPLRDLSGEIWGAMAVLSDVTSTVSAQRDLSAWNDLLARRVAERTSELTAANDELDAFCASISHDLRSPLRAVDGFTKAVLEDYGDRLDDEGRQYLHRVRAASWRMADLLDDLLGLTRLSRSPMVHESIDLSILASEICERLHATDPSRQVSWKIAPTAMAVGDPRQLRRLLETLFDNAWKFSSKRKSASVEFRVESQGPVPCYAVQDDGVGFEMIYVKGLFKPFERLHRSTEYPGNGIGLATAQRIVARHGGSIWLESAAGEGTTVRFVLGS